MDRWAAAGLAAITLTSAPVMADDAEATGDRIHYRAHVDSVARLYRRQTFPDPSGALVEGGVAAPFYHFAMLRVDDVDAPWRDDSIDAELGAWGNLELGEAGEVGRLDGDLSVARVRQRLPFGYLSLGRQVHAGGAARFVRFDGAAAGLASSWRNDGMATQLGVDAYGGLTVLPRWSARPGYHLLGSAADELLRAPEALPEPDRGEAWMTGGRIYVNRPGIATAGASFHEERAQGGLARRSAALDVELSPVQVLSYHALAIAELDAAALSEVRTSIDVYPRRWVTVSGAYQHLSPALLLSRQSVLSVFSTEAFDEWGIEGDLRPMRWLRIDADGFVQRFEEDELGGRGGARVRVFGGGKLHPMAALGYRRVIEPENGYHGLRGSLSLAPIDRLTLTADGYLYLYDAAIAGVESSMVGVLSAGWQAYDDIEVLLAGSLAHSPWAELDAQATARVSFELDGGGR